VSDSLGGIVLAAIEAVVDEVLDTLPQGIEHCRYQESRCHDRQLRHTSRERELLTTRGAHHSANFALHAISGGRSPCAKVSENNRYLEERTLTPSIFIGNSSAAGTNSPATVATVYEEGRYTHDSSAYRGVGRQWYGKESYSPSTGNTTEMRVIVDRKHGNRLSAELYYWLGDEAIGMPADAEGFPRAPVDEGRGEVVDGKMNIRTVRRAPTPDGGRVQQNPPFIVPGRWSWWT
jgi:hypothetical protein